jgi:regulatory protein
LHDAAIAYVARYAATEVSLLRMLEYRIMRWAANAKASGMDRRALAAQVGTSKHAARDIVARLAGIGAVNDGEFAETRACNLLRAGKSYRTIDANLAAKGVTAEVRHTILSGYQTNVELAAALVLAHRRRIGPYRRGDRPYTHGRQQELAIFARAGFPRFIATRALEVALDEAEELVRRLRLMGEG